MILAQALPPMWVMALAAYVLFAVPVAFTAAAVTGVLSLTSVRRQRIVRILSVLALAAGLLNVAALAAFRAIDRQATPLAGEDWRFLGMVLATILIAAVAVVRSRSASN